jgi:uncharacterized membrane protein YcgQ (UPF0703/DUF1980 family)
MSKRLDLIKSLMIFIGGIVSAVVLISYDALSIVLQVSDALNRMCINNNGTITFIVMIATLAGLAIQVFRRHG